jgi:undecaprenyl diphosphate synthase
LNPFKALLYRLYERRLLREVSGGKKPRHLGVILDGNRRFAIERGMGHLWGHEKGYENVEKLLQWCLDLGVDELTLYAFSTENFTRSPEEVEALMDLLVRACTRLAQDPLIQENHVKVQAIGRLELLPERLRNAIRLAEEATKDHGGLHLNIALSYGGRAEIIDAVKKIYRKIENGELSIDAVDETVVGQHLYKEGMHDPDMIIRTSGEMRLSGFLLWQSAYSELYFAEANFPDFRKVDFLRAVRTYQRRERRYGR